MAVTCVKGGRPGGAGAGGGLAPQPPHVAGAAAAAAGLAAQQQQQQQQEEEEQQQQWGGEVAVAPLEAGWWPTFTHRQLSSSRQLQRFTNQVALNR